jgi:hypothetical protein
MPARLLALGKYTTDAPSLSDDDNPFLGGAHQMAHIASNRRCAPTSGLAVGFSETIRRTTQH